MLSYTQARTLLTEHGQEHVLRFWDHLDAAEKSELLAQVSALDWERLDEWIATYVTGAAEAGLPADLRPAPYFPLNAETEADARFYARARQQGVDLLKAGKIAAFTVAGGQGTRLGYDAPKGTYPISPVKGKSLFQLFAEGVARAQEKYGSPILWVVMTSPLNDGDTRQFFADNGYFGLAEDNLLFAPQGTMPAFGMDGKLILGSRASLALSPNGHGGSLLMLRNSGALDRMKQMGVEQITYWQVDNAIVQPFDPLFIGLHALTGAEMSCRSLTKTGPFEKLGNFCLADGRTIIIEYSDMPESLATEVDGSGRLSFRAGSPAIHLLSRRFAERLTAGGALSLPFHRAEKKVPHVSADGQSVVTPDKPNGIKLETFIFDALPLADNVLILEADRGEDFAPVKNPTGVDSVESCRDLMVDRDARWLEMAGIRVPRTAQGKPACTVELSRRTFLDPEDVAARAAFLPAPATDSSEYYA